MLGKGLDQLAQGNLTYRIDTPFGGSYEDLRQDYNKAVVTLRRLVRQIAKTADHVNGEVNEFSAASEDLCERSESQAAAIVETSMSLQELSVTVQQTTESVTEARQDVRGTVTTVNSGQDVMQRASHAMDEVQSSFKQVTNIISVIDDISFQTNLLALNAGVEAARAGDAGRGFAVVASEVRSLAQRASDAAKDIKELLRGGGEKVTSAVDLMGETSHTMADVVDSVTKFGMLFDETATAAQAQALTIQEIDKAVQTMGEATNNNAGLAESSTEIVHNIRAETARLSELISQFTIVTQDEDGREDTGRASQSAA